MSLFGMRASQMVDPSRALRGRSETMPVPERHTVLGTPLAPPYPAGTEIAEFALGCFWGEERKFWQTPGVVSTSVGYEGGYTPNPTYEEVCSGRTGHAETVRVVFDPAKVSYAALLKVFWESHDPTQGMRQGNDAGTQYRSVIFYHSEEQRAAAEESRAVYREEAGRGRLRRRSPRRSSRPASSTSPRTTTSSTFRTQEPLRVLPGPRHRRVLPGRRGPRRQLTLSAAPSRAGRGRYGSEVTLPGPGLRRQAQPGGLGRGGIAVGVDRAPGRPGSAAWLQRRPCRASPTRPPPR